jgi:hypothetical protein
MSRGKQPANVIALSSSFALILLCVLLGACARSSDQNKPADQKKLATVENQPAAKPIVYQKGATVIAKFNGAKMTIVPPPGGQMDLTADLPMVYAGSIAVILPDGANVDADCPLKTLRTLHGYSAVSAGKRSQQGLQSTFVSKEQSPSPQQVALLYNGRKWRVTDIAR